LLEILLKIGLSGEYRKDGLFQEASLIRVGIAGSNWKRNVNDYDNLNTYSFCMPPASKVIAKGIALSNNEPAL
jgi:hypothetical protein